jgi:acetylornithine/N-succinyldiaminopimelate aminotransferase
VPIGAVVAHGVAAETFQPGNHGTTFGGNPLAMRAGLTTIRVMEEEGLLDRAQRIGTSIVEGLRSELAGIEGIVEIRGGGLMIGIELDRPCADVVPMALQAGLVVNVTADRVIRLLPPLIFDAEHAGILVSRLAPVIRTVLGGPAPRT